MKSNQALHDLNLNPDKPVFWRFVPDQVLSESHFHEINPEFDLDFEDIQVTGIDVFEGEHESRIYLLVDQGMAGDPLLTAKDIAAVIEKYPDFELCVSVENDGPNDEIRVYFVTADRNFVYIHDESWKPRHELSRQYLIELSEIERDYHLQFEPD